AVRIDGAGPECQRRNMAFADGAKAQDKSTAIVRRAGLVGMPNDARIEQSRCLKGILIEKIRTDQAALRLAQFGMRRQRILHVCGAPLENIEQVSMAAFKVFEDVGQLLLGSTGIEPKNPANDMVGPNLGGWIEVPGFSRRFERL